MRILLTAVPTVGHFHPLVPLAQAAAQAGHEVAVATGSALLPLVDRVGFLGFRAGLDSGHAERAHPALRTLPGPERADYFWQHIFAAERAQAMLPDLLALSARWQPHVIVRDQAELGGYLAAERLGLPHAVVQTVVFRPRLHHLMAAPLNRLRVAGGLAADPSLDTLYRYLFLSTAPPSYPDPTIAFPPTTHPLRPVPFDQSGDEPRPAWLDALPDQPIVYATLGTTSVNRRPDIFRAILEGLRDQSLTLILTIGRDQDPTQFGPQPPHVHVERYVPQTHLFPRCRVVIAHGGSGTTMAALAHGLPMVLAPLAADQPENAERCAALGVARVIQPAALTPETVRTNVLTVLRDPVYQHNARRLRAEIAAMPGPEHAVELLERLVVDKGRAAAASSC